MDARGEAGINKVCTYISMDKIQCRSGYLNGPYWTYASRRGITLGQRQTWHIWWYQVIPLERYENACQTGRKISQSSTQKMYLTSVIYVPLRQRYIEANQKIWVNHIKEILGKEKTIC